MKLDTQIQQIQIKEVSSLMRKIANQVGKSTGGYYNDSIICTDDSSYIWDEFAYANGIMDFDGYYLKEESMVYSVEIGLQNKVTIKDLKETLSSITKMVKVELLMEEIKR